MSVSSKIEWTQATWNPITGCTKCSAGCEHCYADTLAKRLKAMGNVRYKNGFNVTIHRDLFSRPLEWRKPRRIFVNSMSDLFHDAVDDKTILELFGVMNQADQHTFQVLTKRPDRMLDLSSHINWTPNIWMGVTIENRDSLYRLEPLKKCGARIKFVSAEPLLESIGDIDLNSVDWIIVGGESGAGHRRLERQWVIELRDAAKTAHVPFFFKQWGGFHRGQAGSSLDGIEYKEFPVLPDADAQQIRDS